MCVYTYINERAVKNIWLYYTSVCVSVRVTVDKRNSSVIKYNIGTFRVDKYKKFFLKDSNRL